MDIRGRKLNNKYFRKWGKIMDLLNDKLAMIANNIETAILQDLNTIGDIVETLEGTKKVFTDKNGEKYIIFGKVRYNIKDYKEVTFKKFLEKLK